MEEEEKFKPIVVTRKLIEKDYENKVCVECKCPMPSFVSINNAILLCNQCAERHMKLGYNVSYIRHITDDWDAYLYTYLDRGGNSRFIRLSKKYDLDNMPIEQKYNTRILEYYRLLIKSEVLADIPPFEIPFEVAKDPINNNVIYFPEFQNYQIYQGTLKPEKKKTSGYLDAFRYVGSGLGSMASYLANKYQEYDMNDKLIKGGALAAKGIAAAGNLLYKIAKPVVKYASIRTVQGVGYLCKQAEYQLSDDEIDDEEEEEEEKDDNKNKDKNKINNDKKKKKGKKKKTKKDNNDSNINQSTNQSSLCLKEGNYIFEPCLDYPTFESINKINDVQNNNNDINNNININNFNGNNFQNNFNINQNYQNNNNQIPKPEYVIPPGLDSSSHENSIIGEK